jgi:hypothetical protein
MSLDIDPKEFITFKAETKNELKWIRKEIGKALDELKEINKKLSNNSLDISILKTKAILYATIGGFVISVLINIGIWLLKGV